MPSLLDIADLGETVTVRGTPVLVTGVSAHGFAVLLQRFPVLREALAGREVAAERLMEIGPEAVAAIIAAGTGSPGNAQAEAVAASLPVGDQIDLIEATLRMTLPRGVGPLVERVAALASVVGAASPKAPDSK